LFGQPRRRDSLLPLRLDVDGMWSYQIDETRRLVFTTAWEVIDATDIQQHRQQLRYDVRFQRTFFQLLDFTRVTAVALDYQTILELTRENIFSRESRRAFVAPNPPAYAASRLYISIRQFSVEAEQMEVFKHCDEGLRWLFQS
jgi:hypothetical protein